MGKDDTGLQMESVTPGAENIEGQAQEETTPNPQSVEPEESTKPAEDQKKTKRISDRINKIKAENEQRIAEIEKKHQQEISERDAKLYRYMAEEQGISVEEVRNQEEQKRKEQADALKEALENDPEYRRLRESEFERQKNDVLSALREAYPEDGIEDLDHFDQEFYKMLQVGVDPVRAYKVCVADEVKKPPRGTGSVRTDNQPDAHYYSEEQVRAMSDKEVLAHYDDITKSMKTWPKKE